MADSQGPEPRSVFTPTPVFKTGLLPIRVTIHILVLSLIKLAGPLGFEPRSFGFEDRYFTVKLETCI